MLQKVVALSDRYPGSRHLICRKTRVSMSESVLVTLETKVFPSGHPILKGPHRSHRSRYVFPNDSEIVVGGLDNSDRLFSTEYDTVSVFEATEVSEHDWESLHRSLRNGRMGWHQALADCNPGPSSHWLNQRAATPRMLRLISRHEDNPELYDVKAGAWTHHGAQYIERLDRLTGIRYLRLRKGVWASAEGLVYEDWDPAIHLIDRFEIPADWSRFWGVDFGYTLRHPFVWAAWAMDGQGALYRYREIHCTGRLVEDHARQILEVSGWNFDGQRLVAARTNPDPLPVAIICDHDAEGRATLERHLGMVTTPAYKSVLEGIEGVSGLLRKAGDGRARLFFLRDSLVEVDPVLQDAKRPLCTESEFESYVWDISPGRRKGERPVKDMDDGLDQTRYVVAHVMDLQRDPSKEEVYLEYEDAIFLSGI